jgi:aspartate carbamoyltransferase catalytic subunit
MKSLEPEKMQSAAPRHCIDVSDLDDATVERLFSRAARLRELFATPAEEMPATLRGQVVATLFFEPSTRTRLSFELAAQRLSGIALLFDVGRSSLEKDESLYDTLRTIESMGVTMAVLRHRDDHVFDELRGRTGLSLLNAGNGTQAHPTQALLDAFTLRQRLGELASRVVVISGDVLHSRVARSNVHLLKRLSARVILTGPPALLPQAEAAARFPDAEILPLAAALPQADALMCLRVQRERHVRSTAGDGNDATAVPWGDAYLEQYGLTTERFATLRPDCVLLHPGPVNRGVEIDSSLVEHPRSLVLEQVRNGVYIRMALMEWIAGALL